MVPHAFRIAALALLAPTFALAADAPRPGARLDRRGDEIVAAGQLFHATTPVVTWLDPGGYDAYRIERRFVPPEEASWEATAKAGALKSPERFGSRRRAMTPEQLARLEREGWTLPLLQDVVDQFVIHFDVCGTSRRCFQVLHDARGLSVHFMLDLDGTIYQTLDLKEGAWHATSSNGRSIGIEIANMGAYGEAEKDPFDRWYEKGADGKVRIKIADPLGQNSLRVADADLSPARNELITGNIQGRDLRQYDLTPAQYESLARLTATLCTVFPRIKPDYPRGPDGKLVPQKLPDPELKAYQGILGHYHVQTNKVDPGPAFQWDRLMDEVRRLMAR